MFELLLQADKAIAGGFLDQAEKTYWQLIELDPTNAIAVAGLARISMERGDERMAKNFAERALGIDPDSILARRLLDWIEHGRAGNGADEPPSLPLLAVEQLEAISRRRSKDTGAAGDSPETLELLWDETSKPAAAATPTATPGVTPKKDRGKTRPDQIGSMPAEPLRERRQAGRLAAAAAAAAAAAREPVRSRHEPHHAMPVGRFRFDAGSLKGPAVDGFSAAEMAAAVAAVDDLDDAAPQAGAAAPQGIAAVPHLGGTDPKAGELGDPLGTVDATDAADSVALRLAMLGGEVDLDAAEREAALDAESESEAADDMFEAAEAVASGYLTHLPRATPPSVAPATTASEWPSLTDQSEFPGADSAEAEAEAEAAAEAETPVQAESASEAEAAVQAVAAAEARAAAEALREVAGSAPAAPQATDDDRPYVRRSLPTQGANDPTEEEAEAQALREAMAIVLAGDGEAGEAVSQPDKPKPSVTESAVDSEAPAEAATVPQVDHGQTAGNQATEPEPEAGPAKPEPTPERRRGGIFHRIRGN
jgi:tetratricopeptide (TPR) repeat protein